MINKVEKVLITGCGGMLGEALYKVCTESFTNVLATDIDIISLTGRKMSIQISINPTQ